VECSPNAAKGVLQSVNLVIEFQTELESPRIERVGDRTELLAPGGADATPGDLAELCVVPGVKALCANSSRVRATR